MTQQKRECPDRQTQMHPIKLIDRTGEGEHTEVGYASGDAERGWFFGTYSELGKIQATMCPSCGRIIFHGDASTIANDDLSKCVECGTEIAPGISKCQACGWTYLEDAE